MTEKSKVSELVFKLWNRVQCKEIMPKQSKVILPRGIIYGPLYDLNRNSPIISLDALFGSWHLIFNSAN